MVGFSIGPWKRAFVELQQTGRTSQEHGQFLTGMTNAGRTLGTPLGPDGRSLWLRADLEFSGVRVSPWAEWIRYSSDQYTETASGEIEVGARGTYEHRQRLGLEAELALSSSWRLQLSGFAERVGNADLVVGETRLNAGLLAAAVYSQR